MTPTERAAWQRALLSLRLSVPGDVVDHLEFVIAAAIEQARREEREACAMVAENFYGEAPHYITVEMGHAEADIAAAIRARAQESGS